MGEQVNEGLLVTIHVKADMPLPALDDIRLSTLRRLHAEKLAAVRAEYPTAEHLRLTLVFYCDLEQRARVEDLPFFVAARLAPRAVRLDFGFCESYRFKWKHIENGEVVRG